MSSYLSSQNPFPQQTLITEESSLQQWKIWLLYLDTHIDVHVIACMEYKSWNREHLASGMIFKLFYVHFKRVYVCHFKAELSGGATHLALEIIAENSFEHIFT